MKERPERLEAVNDKGEKGEDHDIGGEKNEDKPEKKRIKDLNL